MQIFQDIFKCSKCNNYVEASGIVNIDDISDKYVCNGCEND